MAVLGEPWEEDPARSQEPGFKCGAATELAEGLPAENGRSPSLPAQLQSGEGTSNQSRSSLPSPA